ncbi:hypothetical protein RF007C_08330 [Ruminococcus flavefaciens 007c]|uniref:Uncharacterized protein n=1 Tax=Ruminococcus flavefaciens 007c TaxID=1341157 RepID=W7ULR2_RUMFL|nr:hypothetical protein RF007C_08330 [Ruminococcus flavefaciens 007c]
MCFLPAAEQYSICCAAHYTVQTKKHICNCA